MKFFTSIFSIFLLLALVLPIAVSALSCAPTEMMLEMYAEDDYVIFSGTVERSAEHVKQKAEEDNPNKQFIEGYTAQFVTAETAYKGLAKKEQWVYHRSDSTWGYMCSRGPVPDGEEALFVLSVQDGIFALPTVVDSYPLDSELAKQIIAAVADAETDSSILEFSKENWRDELARELKEMVFLLRIKLAEWRWWGNQ